MPIFGPAAPPPFAFLRRLAAKSWAAFPWLQRSGRHPQFLSNRAHPGSILVRRHLLYSSEQPKPDQKFSLGIGNKKHMIMRLLLCAKLRFLSCSEGKRSGGLRERARVSLERDHHRCPGRNRIFLNMAKQNTARGYSKEPVLYSPSITVQSTSIIVGPFNIFNLQRHVINLNNLGPRQLGKRIPIIPNRKTYGRPICGWLTIHQVDRTVVHWTPLKLKTIGRPLEI